MSRDLPNCTMFDLFRDFLLAFFRYLKGKFRNKRAGKQQQKNERKICKHAKCRNLRYYNVSRDENPHRDNELDYPSVDGFHAQLDCKITNVLKKWGETLHYVSYGVSVRFLILRI